MSPDQNPTAHQWKELKHAACRRHSSKMRQLQKFEWTKLPAGRCKRHIESYRKVLVCIVFEDMFTGAIINGQQIPVARVNGFLQQELWVYVNCIHYKRTAASSVHSQWMALGFIDCGCRNNVSRADHPQWKEMAALSLSTHLYRLPDSRERKEISKASHELNIFHANQRGWRNLQGHP